VWTWQLMWIMITMCFISPINRHQWLVDMCASHDIWSFPVRQYLCIMEWRGSWSSHPVTWCPEQANTCHMIVHGDGINICGKWWFIINSQVPEIKTRIYTTCPIVMCCVTPDSDAGGIRCLCSEDLRTDLVDQTVGYKWRQHPVMIQYQASFFRGFA
jgi:hypothetical protein